MGESTLTRAPGALSRGEQASRVSCATRHARTGEIAISAEWNERVALPSGCVGATRTGLEVAALELAVDAAPPGDAGQQPEDPFERGVATG